MEEKIKSLVIIGNVNGVKRIIEEVIEEYGGKTPVIDIIKKYNKNTLILS